MRTAQLQTNLRCNQACGYCDSRATRDDLKRIQFAALSAEMKESRAAGASELVLSGGEPTLRPDLPRLVSAAIELGFERIVLATNGTLIDNERALELAAAGLTSARVNVSGDESTLSLITRDPEAWPAVIAGLHAFAAAKVPYQVCVTLLRTNISQVTELPLRLAEAGLHPESYLLLAPADGAETQDLASYEELVGPVVEFTRRCRQQHIPVSFDPRHHVPPCCFPKKKRPQLLYHLARSPQRGGFESLPGCADCLIQESCPGVPSAYLARVGTPAYAPISDDRARRRLTLSRPLNELIDQEFSQRIYNRNQSSDREIARLIRINFRCNQDCEFCYVATHLPDVSHERVLAEIDSALEGGGAINFSGGEPSLNPHLVEYVTRASGGARNVTIETNATKISAQLGKELERAGLSGAFISLHGCTPEISDRITRAPGTFVQTLVGLDNLQNAGVETTINFVLCGENLHQAAETAELVMKRWPDARFNLSFVAPSSDLVPRTKALIPRYTDASQSIAEVFEVMGAQGREPVGFESMCSLPMCTVPTDLRQRLTLADVQEDFEGEEFLKPDCCAECDLRSKCWGVRRGYAEIHGTSELSPVKL